MNKRYRGTKLEGRLVPHAAAYLRIVEAQSYRCAFTGAPLTPENAAIDHATPVSREGSDDPANLLAVTSKVNYAKGALTAEEFIDLCRQVVAHADRNEPEEPEC